MFSSNFKTLVCAFACVKDPDRRFGFGEGGEAVLGWNIVLQIARFSDTYVLTDISNKDNVEKELKKEKISNMHFFYIGLPTWLQWIKKLPGGIQVYSYLWQARAYFFAKKLHPKIHFNVFHHVTYANDWMASFIGALLPITYIRGPGGGAHRVPKSFLKEYSFGEFLNQKIRSAGQFFFRHDPFFIISQKKAKAILVCGQEAFNAVSKTAQSRVYFFPVNGISEKDLDLCARSKYSPTDSFCIITAGKMLKIKSFDLAIKAFKIFSGKVSNSQLIIVGDGPELENLKKLADLLKIQDKVIFKQWMQRENLLEHIANADIFLFPSLRDGGGQVVVEAMACSKPVVCFDIAGPGFHINEKWGIKIKPVSPEQSVKDMSEAMELLYYNKELRVKMAEKARKRAEEFYSWDALGNRLQKIYAAIITNYEK